MLLGMENELALRMLDAVERLAIENGALKAIFKAYPEHSIPWEQHLSEAMGDPLACSNIRQQLAPLRSQIQSSPDLSEAIRRLLSIFPANKQVN